jgi:hypothetical protein
MFENFALFLRIYNKLHNFIIIYKQTWTVKLEFYSTTLTEQV